MDPKQMLILHTLWTEPGPESKLNNMNWKQIGWFDKKFVSVFIFGLFVTGVVKPIFLLFLVRFGSGQCDVNRKQKLRQV